MRSKTIVKPITTEKVVKMMEIENTIVFIVDRRGKKPEIRKEFESLFNEKVKKINTSTRANKKYAFIKLKKEGAAADIATKLGLL